MSISPAPLFVCHAKAAQLLDVKPAEFLGLVADGHLPKGKEIAPGYVRWSVDDLRLIGSGGAVEGGGIQW